MIDNKVYCKSINECSNQNWEKIKSFSTETRQCAKKALNEAIESVKESKLSNTKQEQFIIETNKMIELLESELAKSSSLQQKMGNIKIFIPLITI